MSSHTTDVIVIGAGIIGATCAYRLAERGLRVTVVERAGIAGGTSSACEGNILVSDKEPGPELDLVLLSTRLWLQTRDDLGEAALEYESKGGVVVARNDAIAGGLARRTAHQRAAGVDAQDVGPEAIRERELVGGAWYPDDAQVQPMLATASLLRRARAGGAVLHTGTTVTGLLRDPAGRVTGVTTDSPTVPVVSAPWVVNAAGSWAGAIADMAGAPIPILPRRGFILVTEPLPCIVRHKVYTADYVANVASSSAGLETSVVIEGTRGGTILIGASRERVGFDRTWSMEVVRRLARQAIGVFPFLADVSLLRTYMGFRPYCPDHLPVIGEDPRAPGLVHACGHEGAGIGLSAATGHVIAQHIAGVATDVDLAPFRPDRFPEAAA